MSHPLFGTDGAACRDVFVSPSRLARETGLIDEVYTLLEPHLDTLSSAYRDELDANGDADETGERAIADAVEAVRHIAAGGRADADAAHETLLQLAVDLADSLDFHCAAVSRLAGITATWLSIRMGRRLRDDSFAPDPAQGFGEPVHVLALSRMDTDYTELLDAVVVPLRNMEPTRALDRLGHHLDQVIALVDDTDGRYELGDPTERPPLAEDLFRRDIDHAALRERLEHVAHTAGADGDPDARVVVDAAETLALWSRARHGHTERATSQALRRLVENIAWLSTGQPVAPAVTVTLDPASDRAGVVQELRCLYRSVVGDADPNRPEISGAEFGRGIASVVSGLRRLPPDRRLAVLFGWISPLLDELAWEDGEFRDEPEMTTAQAVERFRRIAAGEDDDAVHSHLASFALVESEDQDPNMHVRSQAAFLAADWLCLRFGRTLRIDEEELGDHRPQDLTGIVNTLACTRARQVSTPPESFDALAEDLVDEGCLPVTPLVELRAMRDDLSETR